MKSMARFAPLLLALLCIVANTPTAEATRVRALDLETLSKRAVAIAVVQSERHAARWDGEGRIVTDSEVVVVEAVKGLEVGERLLITTLGGAIGELGMRIEGEVPLTVGQQHLVFLRQNGADWRPLGMSQGVMPVEENNGRQYLVPGAQGVSPTRNGATTQSALVLRRPLPMVLEQVRGFLAED